MIAMYIRLSSADEDTGFRKTESESVSNQRKYITQFLNEHQTLSAQHRREFVDDGYSGLYADRPQLTLMMQQVHQGEITVICVKDFSRFFRDYIEAGRYLESVFPLLGVRFIAINDHYDSDDYKGTTGGMEMVMRNIVYAMYSKDLSLKIKSGKMQRMKQGQFIGSHAPYGYQKNPNDPRKLIPDAKAAKVVQMIFTLAQKGYTTREIAVHLNRENIPTQGQYFKMQHPNQKKYSNMYDAICWNPTRVRAIIQNQVYIGNLVTHRREKIRHDSQKTRRTAPIITENTHPGIVTKQTFQAAQAAIQHIAPSHNKNAANAPLQSLVRCGCCAYRMKRRVQSQNQYAFICANAAERSEKGCRLHEKIDETILEHLAMQAIQHCLLAAKPCVHIAKTKSAHSASVQQKDILRKIAYLKQAKLYLYEKYASAALSTAQYCKQKEMLEQKLAQCRYQETALQQKIHAQSESAKKNALEKTYTALQDKAQFTHAVSHLWIKTIDVYPENVIEITMNFADVFARIAKL